MRIYTALRLIKVRLLLGIGKDWGICKHISGNLTYDQKNWVKNKMLEWPDGTRSRMFPVPMNEYSKRLIDAEYAFDHYPMWDSSSEYGRNRRKLLTYLLAEFKGSKL